MSGISELYVTVDDSPEAIAEAMADIRRLKGVYGVGSVSITSQSAMNEAYGEYKKLVELHQGGSVMVSPEALDRAERLVLMAAQVHQAESLGKIVAALDDGNITYWMERIIAAAGATR